MEDVGRLAVLVRQLQGLLGGKALRVGADVVTWPGGAPRANNTGVAHGLAVTPVAVFAVASSSLVAGTVLPVMAAFAPGSSSFSVSAVTSDGSSPVLGATATFYWLAVG